jgi:hypothetical protein
LQNWHTWIVPKVETTKVLDKNLETLWNEQDIYKTPIFVNCNIVDFVRHSLTTMLGNLKPINTRCVVKFSGSLN